MIAFCVILFFMLLIGARLSKKNAAAKKRLFTEYRTNASAPIQRQPSTQPNPVTLSLVTKHFGQTWQRYLLSQSAQLSISNPYIYNVVALCYERLQQEEFSALLQAFKMAGQNIDDYSLLHEGIYQLAKERGFTENEVMKLIRDLPKRYHTKRVLEAVTLPVTYSSAHSGPPKPVVVPAPKKAIEILNASKVIEKEAKSGMLKIDEDGTNSALILSSVVESVKIEKSQNQSDKGSDETEQTVVKDSNTFVTLTAEPDIIDIDLDVKPIVYTEKITVPVWSHQYVYSAGELRRATSAQQKFYAHYKAAFYNDRHIDLQGNTNYGFILFFELLDDYARHQNIELLERLLHDLEISCPRTQPYAKSNLLRLMRAVGELGGVERLENTQNNHWQWREKFIRQLKLSNADTELLNSIWLSGSGFMQIEFCARELIRLYVAAMNVLAKELQQQQTSKKAVYEFIGDLIARKQNRYRTGSANYKYTVEHSDSALSGYILRYCEGELRTHLGHNRKVNYDSYLEHSEVISAIREKIIAPIAAHMPELLKNLSQPDEPVEVALNAISPTRWKSRLQLTSDYYNSIGLDSFKNEVDLQLRLNVQNSSLDIIFQDVVKFLAQHDKPTSLQYYLRYSHYCFGIKNTDPKPMPKNLQKVLFNAEIDVKRFDEIVIKVKAGDTLIDLLAEAMSFYAPVRKKIKLDTTLIQHVEQQYSGTVELLNEYLQDEEPVAVPVQPVMTILPLASTTSYTITFTAGQSGLIELFREHEFSLQAAVIDSYCQSAGLVRSPLVNDINELCYELLDDLLIEEQDQYYIINPQYYQQLIVS